ncbi:MAG: hypothetical protein NT153_13090 [Bacteroidetes bacterium]|nr:hypothetical protein [Bacteroidota bacterium]
MSLIQEKALVHLTGTANLGSVKEDSLLELANESPYFAPIQLLLSAKLKESNANSFTNQAQKTNFYFSNPYWVHYLLSDFGSQNNAINQVNPLLTAVSQPNAAHSISQPISSLESPSAKVLAIDTNESVAGIEAPSLNPASEIQIPTVESVVDLLQRINHPYEEAAATAESNTKIANLLSEQLADFKKPVSEEAKLEITREPLHTSDYFASQGIKIDLSQIPQDKLTTQLRRFTDWLKYMKTDNPTAVDLGTRHDLEEAVILIAKTSNEQKEIVTETMAEIFQKQGQVQKAIQLYIKLSFINPEKSAYFAAKIQHLKGI